MSRAFLRGFQNLTEEVENRPLLVKGALPGWLQGRLLRNGPALFDVEGRPYNHWFDGLAMLHRFAFRDDGVFYTNRFLRSRNYQRVMAERKMAYDQFSTNPPRSFWQKLLATLDYTLQFGNNDLVNFAQMGDGIVALGETPTPLRIDAETLATRGPFRFRDWILGMITTAHPVYDRPRRELYNYTTFVFPFLSSYKLYHLPFGETRRKRLATIRAGQPSYMHSFGASADHLILTEFPLVLNPWSMLFNSFTNSPFITNFSWKPDLGTRFLVIDKRTGRVTGRFRSEGFFAFHHINAWREGRELVVDIAAYDDSSIIEKTYLKTLAGPHGGTLSYSGIRRFRVPVEGEGEVEGFEAISRPAFEMPWIHPECPGQPYRYAYGYGFEEPGNFNDLLLKVDTHDRDPDTNYRKWCQSGCYPGEPIFVPRPGAVEEDDGAVLSVVLDAEAGESFLLVLDAASFEETARAPTPHPIPFGLHGAYDHEFAGPP